MTLSDDIMLDLFQSISFTSISVYFMQHCIIDWGQAYKTVIQPVQVLQN